MSNPETTQQALRRLEGMIYALPLGQFFRFADWLVRR